MPSPAAASRPRPIVVVADPLAPEGLALLRERCEVLTPKGPDELQASLGSAIALLVRS